MENNNANNANGNNGDANINIINNNYYAEEYNVNREQEPINNVQVLPVAMHSNMLRMLYELRVPVYALGALGGGRGGGAYDDDDDNHMEQQAIEVLSRSLYDIRPVKRVIDVEDGESGKKHGIREMTYDPETAEELKINTACGIWQEEFEKGEEIKIMPCNHAFRGEAITKWLTTEKAECPICRFKLEESKEVIVHPSAGEDDMPRLVSDNDTDTDTDDEAEESWQRLHQQSHPQPHPPINEQRARENNIMYRQNNNIYNRAHGGGAADMGREYYYGISAPMNRLLQMRTGFTNGARAGGGAARAVSQHQPIQPSHAPQPQSQPQSNPSIMNINNINNYFISSANNNINQDYILDQEQADIEEAIRRSLE
jgi:hypothetical protein